MRRSLLVALASLALNGCVAETVERHPPRRGPVKEVGYVDFGGGRVRYSAEGWGPIVASRRRTAERLMRRNCGELEPHVTDEFTREDADVAYAGEDVTSSMASGEEHYHIERYVHLSYECRPKGAPEAPALSTAPAGAPLLLIPPAVSTQAAVQVSSPSAPAAPVEPPK